jgi:ABC-type cobalamin/Fe3+-siderophores transport system ATPase subunit
VWDYLQSQSTTLTSPAVKITMTSRPIILGIVGDSAAGKTTLTRGIAQVLGTIKSRLFVRMITTAMIASSELNGNFSVAPRLQLSRYY